MIEYPYLKDKINFDHIKDEDKHKTKVSYVSNTTQVWAYVSNIPNLLLSLLFYIRPICDSLGEIVGISATWCFGHTWTSSGRGWFRGSANNPLLNKMT